MKAQLIAIVAVVGLVGCGITQQGIVQAPGISIHEAAWKGDIKSVKQHLTAGETVNATNIWASTPLHYAVRAGHKETTVLLILKGADVNAKNNEKRNPLHRAAMDGHKEIAELLISEEADMNAKDQDGLAPLHYSARAVHKEIVELLINNGADVNVRSTANLTPLDLSSGEVADLIRKQGGKTSKELIALSKAARTGNIAEVKKHLAAGADVNAKDM
jgi:ankyrin repeat protein